MDGWMDGWSTVQYSTIQYNTVQYSSIIVLFLQIMTRMNTEWTRYIHPHDFILTIHYPSFVPDWVGEVRITVRPGLLITRAIAGQLGVRMYYYTLFYCTIFYYPLLYYTLLYYTILYYTILCTILYYTILYYALLYCTIFNYTILYSSALYSTLVSH